MIQFFINNVEIVLPSNFSYTEIEENPLVTRNGQFSLDITTYLLDGQNAIAFKHVNRLNSSNNILNGDCLLLKNGKSIFGTYVILEYTNTFVRWQFIAGNSYLNFVAKNNKKIWELDFGTENEVDFELAKRSLQYPGFGTKTDILNPTITWSQNYVCVPISSGDVILNNYYFDNVFDETVNFAGVNNITIQPYLLYYISKLPGLLGYTMKDNALEQDDRAKYMYMLNTVNSLKYNDFLPDMTIQKFIESIERFFNVSFILDPRKKEMAIIKTNEYIKSLPVENLEGALDDFVAQSESDNDLNISFFCSKIEFENLNSTDFHKYNKLSEDVLSKLEIKEFDTLSLIIQSLSGTGGLYSGKPILYVDRQTGNHYMYQNATNFDFPTVDLGYYQVIRKINKFRDITLNNYNLGKVTLAISPASIFLNEVEFKYRFNNIDRTIIAQVQIAQASNSNFVDETKRFDELVEQGINSLPRLSYVEAAFFVGNISFHSENSSCVYPFSFVDNYADSEYQQHLQLEKRNCTFRIYGENGIANTYYTNLVLVEKGLIYTLNIDEKKPISTQRLYVYNNQLYLPVKFDRTIGDNNTKTKGYFYRIK